MRKFVFALPVFAMFCPAVAQAGNFDGFYAGAQLGGAVDTIERNQTAPAFYAGQYKTDSLAAVGVTGTIFAGYGMLFKDTIYLGAEMFGTFGNRDYSYKETDPSAPYKEKNKFGNQWGFNVRPGYLINDKALIYGLLGYERVSMSSSSTSADAASYDKTNNAFQLGVGTEITVNGPLAMRIDYAHTFIPDITVTNSIGISTTYKAQEDSFKIGFSYHF
ncbi:outer membrane beta-barrel protein [Telmatospirillum sp.]|uniref:outer membrane protein n=1 Tax=Telmatospirillum sp. TaxID=2079197 RepID=UPI00284D1386|nr:outer membrane beta-barrel protein [Telmatospirillum sp.]MDR3435308.1 outer membrane beta-barrel protein [Telmatospirillum sp.]